MLTNHQWDVVAITESNFTGNAQDIYPWYEFENCSFKITTSSRGGQGVNTGGLNKWPKFCHSPGGSIYLSGEWHFFWYYLRHIFLEENRCIFNQSFTKINNNQQRCQQWLYVNLCFQCIVYILYFYNCLPVHKTMLWLDILHRVQWPFLLTRFNFNPSMDK